MPLMRWAAHVLQWPVQREATPRGGADPESRPQFVADQHAAVNAFPGLVHTARHTTRVVCTRSRRPNLVREASKVWRARGVKS